MYYYKYISIYIYMYIYIYVYYYLNDCIKIDYNSDMNYQDTIPLINISCMSETLVLATFLHLLTASIVLSMCQM